MRLIHTYTHTQNNEGRFCNKQKRMRKKAEWESAHCVIPLQRFVNTVIRYLLFAKKENKLKNKTKNSGVSYLAYVYFWACNSIAAFLYRFKTIPHCIIPEWNKTQWSVFLYLFEVVAKSDFVFAILYIYWWQIDWNWNAIRGWCLKLLFW